MGKNKFITILLVSCAFLTTLFFNNCENKQNPELTVNSSSASCDTSKVNTQLRRPQTIAAVVSLVNSLPKPLTIDCFLSALQGPLDVYSVNNKFSAQPAYDVNNPRIFIIFGNFTLSIVPMGAGQRLLEMSEIINATQSVKAELSFPIQNQILPEDPFAEILDPSNTQTNCRTCHQSEMRLTNYQGPAYASNIVRPDPVKRILQSYMLYQSQVCDPKKTDLRCKMLKAIFQDGQARDIAEFP